MRLFLAGLEGIEHYDNCSEYINTIKDNFYWLGSFYYLPKNTVSCTRLETSNKENFLLDSGAFTFRFNKSSKGKDIDKYVDEYIAFINKYDIKYFFEMDIDLDEESYKKTLELRDKIEQGTGKKCIPVWHDNRGIDAWLDIIERYDYVAIGGITSTDGKKQEIVKKLIKLANSKGVKVHMLGYNRQDLLDYNAYSCDATSWNGGRFGGLWNWDNINQRPKKINRNKERRIRSDIQKEVYLHNLKVWKHYQDVIRYKGYWRE